MLGPADSRESSPTQGFLGNLLVVSDLLLYLSLSLRREGEEWLKMRSVLRQLIMRPKDVAHFSDDVNAVVGDLVKRVVTLRRGQTDGLTVLNINDLFFKYAMEGG